MRTRATTIMILLASALTAGCGGGGSGGSEGVAVVPGQPAPMPTPTPAPAPTPTPTPTPNPLAGYGTACDGFALKQSSYAISANMRIQHSDRSKTVPDAYIYSINEMELANYDKGLTFKYDPATRTSKTTELLISYAPVTTLYSFDASKIASSSYSSISYADGNRTLLVTCEPGSSISFQRYGSDLRNPALGVKESVFRYQISGPRTATGPELASGSFTSRLSGEIFRTDVQDPARRTEAFVETAPAQLTYDMTAGTITGTIRIGGADKIDLKVMIDTIGGVAFEGTVEGSDGTRGTIIGGFYGPNSREIAYATTFEKFGIHYVGAGSGVRN